jgi:hypothetical protein
MAWTITRLVNTVFGNDRVVMLKVSTDAATQTVETGLSYIYGVSLAPVSMSTLGSFTIQPNSGASGVKKLGYIGCSGFAATDTFYLTVYGR